MGISCSCAGAGSRRAHGPRATTKWIYGTTFIYEASPTVTCSLFFFFFFLLLFFFPVVVPSCWFCATTSPFSRTASTSAGPRFKSGIFSASWSSGRPFPLDGDGAGAGCDIDGLGEAEGSVREDGWIEEDGGDGSCELCLRGRLGSGWKGGSRIPFAALVLEDGMGLSPASDSAVSPFASFNLFFFFFFFPSNTLSGPPFIRGFLDKAPARLSSSSESCASSCGPDTSASSLLRLLVGASFFLRLDDSRELELETPSGIGAPTPNLYTRKTNWQEV